MQSEYKQKFSDFSTETLITMLANRTDFRLEAIAAMEEILQERNLPANEIQSMLSDAEQAKQAQAQLAEEPMPLGLKMTLLVFPVIHWCGSRESLFEGKGIPPKGCRYRSMDGIGVTLLGFIGFDPIRLNFDCFHFGIMGFVLQILHFQVFF